MKQLLPFMSVVALIVGCSDSAPETAANIPIPAAGSTVAVASPSLTPTEKPAPNKVVPSASPAATGEAQKSTAESETLDIGEFFAAPKEEPVVKEPERKPEPEPVLPELPKQEAGPPPPTRLIGFSEIDELKAIVAIDGKLKILALGQSADGVELIGLEPPAVTLKYGETEINIKLNEQPWVYVAGTNTDGNGIGPNMPMPNKPPPAVFPGGQKLPTPPGNARTSKNSLSPTTPRLPEHKFPAASPPPLPPQPQKK
jgi:hypothetical protein